MLEMTEKKKSKIYKLKNKKLNDKLLTQKHKLYF